MIRVIVADDHHLVRQGIRALLERADDIQVIGEAADGQEALKLVEHLAPDVLLTDIAMPLLNGIQTAQQIRARHLGTQVVILSVYADQPLVRQALQSGARGYLLKRSLTEELLLAVRAASRGETYLSPPIAGSILAELLPLQAVAKEASPLDRLTPREHEVLQLIAEGQTNSAIAQILHISIKTVEKHRADLMVKLHVRHLAGLIRVAIKHHVIPLDE